VWWYEACEKMRETSVQIPGSVREGRRCCRRRSRYSPAARGETRGEVG